MTQELLSVGIDIGTSTTQLIFSRLTLENRANPFSVPRIAIADKEVLYRSGIHFTPLLSDTVIDSEGVRAIVEEEYRKSGFEKAQISTGAVIITGETARKENAREVLSTLSGFAGDFVVATAGPDLESILAARGAGIDDYSKEHHTEVLHFDIGGGTSNLALYDRGELKTTGCMDVGGRLIKIDRETGSITYLSPKVRQFYDSAPPGYAARGAPLSVGEAAAPERLAPFVSAMVSALEEIAGLREPTGLADFFWTGGAANMPLPAAPVPCVSFSGGVADCIWSPPEDWLAYGDIGVLLGRAIRESPAFRGTELVRGEETIRATVVGAGSHSTDLSGSTIFYRGVEFPLKNLPILKLTEEEERGGPARLAAAIREKLRWFADEGGLTQTALCLRGEKNPSYRAVKELAQGVREGLEPLLGRGFFPVVVVETDMAKVLGQALAPGISGPLLCLDGVSADNGDYIDIGAPVANGAVLPVVIKTLAFQKN